MIWPSLLPRTLLAPEVIQTSAMDCGPASLKCLLEGFGIRVSYGRLREACQTDVDGTSIDTLEEVALPLPAGGLGILQAAPVHSALESSADAAKLGETQRALEAATRETRLLKARVAELQASKLELENALRESGSQQEHDGSNGLWQGPVAHEGRSWTPWQWLLFGSILLLAFATGGYAVDWESRRRHGGFRI